MVSREDQGTVQVGKGFLPHYLQNQECQHQKSILPALKPEICVAGLGDSFEESSHHKTLTTGDTCQPT